MKDTTTHTITLQERWASDQPHFTIQHAWEILPSMAGQPHLVDPDPDAQYENYPVSLCGTALVSKGGSMEPGAHVCVTCLEVSREREQEAGE